MTDARDRDPGDEPQTTDATDDGGTGGPAGMGGLGGGGSAGGDTGAASGDDGRATGVGATATDESGMPVGGYGGTDDGTDAIVDTDDNGENTADV